MVVTIPRAELLGTLLECVLYGAYIRFFVQCLRVLRRRYLEGRRVLPFVVAAFSIFVLSSMHLISDWIRAIQAFSSSAIQDNGPASFFITVDTPLNLIKTSVYVTATLVADLLIVYRTFLVWNRSYLTVFVPFLLFICDMALSVWATWSLTQVRINDNVLLASVTLRAQYFYAVTLILNLLCTFLISYRIWSIYLLVGVISLSNRLEKIVHVLIESAACYTALLVMLIVTSVLGSPILFVFLNSAPPVIGITFSSVIVSSLDNTKDTVASNNDATTSFVSTMSETTVHVRLEHVLGTEAIGIEKRATENSIDCIV